MDIFANLCETQIIDSRGKLRGFNFKDTSLFCSPSRPIAKPINLIIKEFVFGKPISIGPLVFEKVEYEYDNINNVAGIYFQIEDVEYYIPVKHNGTLLDKNYKYRSLDLRIPKETLDYKKFVYHEKLAKTLNEYTLYNFSVFPNDQETIENFVIDSSHEYDLNSLNGDLFFENNDIMYKNKKLIFPSKESKNACETHLKVSLSNNRPSVMNMKNIKKIRNRFTKIYDFRSNPAEIIFTNNESARNYILSLESDKNMGTISSKFISTIESYYFRNPNIFNGKLVLIQNVNNEDERSYERSKLVVDTWIKDKKNLGYYTDLVKISDEEDRKFYDFENYKGSFDGSFIASYENKFFAVLEI